MIEKGKEKREKEIDSQRKENQREGHIEGERDGQVERLKNISQKLGY